MNGAADRWVRLSKQLDAVTGADRQLDADIALAFRAPDAGYTGSIDACRSLFARCLPDCRLHLGHGASGVFPYASIRNDDTTVLAGAPTVPLAILRAMASMMRFKEPQE